MDERTARFAVVHPKARGRTLALLGILAIGVAGVGLYRAYSGRAARERRANTPVAFPSAELAALDHDLQARFAVVPNDKSFGMDRIGQLHYLYAPHTWNEKQTVTNLRKRNLDVAFYVMSRRTWRNEFGPQGYYPVQGPVYITRKLSLPLPRKELFEVPYREVGPGNYVSDYKKDKRVEEPPNVKQFDPDGTPVPIATPPDSLPEGRVLRVLGDYVMQLASDAQPSINPGAQMSSANRWKIVGTSVRASQQACVNCHNQWNWTEPKKIQLGDPVGVAFYAYRPRQSR